MPFRQIGSAQPKYLAATDILIGDMSNTNYEFLLYDRPVILLANGWLRDNFPDIGIKTDLDGLQDAIERSIKNPDEFKKARKLWLEKTIFKPDGFTAKRYIDIILSRCQIENPRFVFIHGGNSVRKTNLDPLVKETISREIETEYVSAVAPDKARSDTVYTGAHYKDLLQLKNGYKVHIDHDTKGMASNNLEKAIRDHKEHDYMPLTNLYITPGEAGDEYTRTVLGPLNDRQVIGGYPKADDLIKLNTGENKIDVFGELDFDINKPLIAYAPAGGQSYEKPGGSLNAEVIRMLEEIARKTDYNVLVKLKYPGAPLLLRLSNKLKRMVTGMWR